MKYMILTWGLACEEMKTNSIFDFESSMIFATFFNNRPFVFNLNLMNKVPRNINN